MIGKNLALRIFESSYIQRWNDKIRPVELAELDKNSHKMIIAYCLGKYEEAAGKHVDWNAIIRGGIFELLRRTVLSDIKAPVLEQSWLPEFRYFTIDEFASKIREKGAVTKTTSDEINERYNEDRFDPIDGELVSVADKFSAFLEAFMTKEIGLQTRHTEEALRLSGNINGKTVKIAGIDLSDLYRGMLGKMKYQ